MKLLHLTKIATIASLLALSNISCAADPVRQSPTAPSTYNPSTTAPVTAPTTANPNTQGATTGASETRIPEAAAGFKVSKDGRFIPLTKSGKEYSLCSGGADGKNTCAIFNNKVTVREIKTTVITKMTYSVNPTCAVYCEDVGASKPFCYTDPEDPNCAKFN